MQADNTEKEQRIIIYYSHYARERENVAVSANERFSCNNILQCRDIRGMQRIEKNV